MLTCVVYAVAGNCNAIGFVPLCISGGFGPLKPKLGMGIDNIISARLLLSTGEAIDASSTLNADVFEAICGGGRALGIVSELKVTTYSLAETMESADGPFGLARWHSRPSAPPMSQAC